MKKILLITSLIVLCLSLFGCDGTKSKEALTKLIGNQTTKEEKAHQLTIDDAVSKTIAFHNSSEKDLTTNGFPQSIKNGEMISKNIEMGGPSGTTTKLDMSVVVIKNGRKFIVTLIKDYNVTVNGNSVISKWKYELSDGIVKLEDKKDESYLIMSIK